MIDYASGVALWGEKGGGAILWGKCSGPKWGAEMVGPAFELIIM
jgi:hypothetical protein